MNSRDEETIETDALHWYDEVIIVGSNSNDRTTPPGKATAQPVYPSQQRYNEVGNSSPNKNEKPILISSSKGGFFKQGHTIIISPNFKNVVTYQWIKNGISLEHCTGPILEISNASLYHTGDYALIAANTFGIEITPPISVRIV